MLQLHDLPRKLEDMKKHRHPCIDQLVVPPLCKDESVVVGITLYIEFEEHRPKRHQNRYYSNDRQAHHSLNSIKVENIILSTFSFDGVTENTLIQHRRHI